MIVKKELEIGGKTLSFESGRFAKQADSAVMARYGDTMVLATVVAKKNQVQISIIFHFKLNTEKNFRLVEKFLVDF